MRRQIPMKMPAWVTRALAALAVLVGPVGLYNCGPISGPGPEPCGNGEAGQSLSDYAAECAGATLIEVPGFNCDDGTLVPETNETVQPDGTITCDRPNVLVHECDPGSRFQVLNRTQDAFVVAHCRKQNHGDKYGDIAVIQHNVATGATCFYQALGDLSKHVPPPSAGSDPAPDGTGATFQWLTPDATANIKCVQCHDNGPIVRSEYLAQLRDVGENPITHNIDRLPGTSDDDLNFPKTGWNKTQPYSFPGKAFKGWKAYSLSVDGSSCTNCHRLGIATIDGNYASVGTALSFAAIATAPEQQAKNPHSPDSPIWMPPDQIYYDPGLEQEALLYRDCANAYATGGPKPPGCTATLLAKGTGCEGADPAPPAPPSPPPPSLDQAPNVTGEGSCMCSLCWNQPFCFDPTRAEGSQVYPLPCAKPEHQAVDASRLVDADAPKQGGFYCYKPFAGAVMNSASKSCPGTEVARDQVENFDPCVDAPECARPVDQCGAHTAAACPEVTRTARPSTCVAVPDYQGTPFSIAHDNHHGAAAVVSDLAAQCARFGAAPPSGPQPERYCFLSCVSSFDCSLDTGSPACLGCGSTSNVQSVGGTFPVTMTPSLSSAIVSLRDANGNWQPAGTLSLSGRMDFQVPSACRSTTSNATCTATMTRMAFASSGSLTIHGLTVDNVRLLNDNPATGTFVTQSSAGTFSIPAHTKLALTGDVGGLTSRFALIDLAVPINTTWSWSSRTVQFDTTFVSPDGSYQVRLIGSGSFASLPPTSVVTASTTTPGCGAPTRLSAANSLDPEGAADIKSVTWTTDLTDLNDWQASGTTVDVYPQAGTHRYYAKVVDGAGSAHTSYVDVTSNCAGCADGSADQLVTLGVVGCGGTQTWDHRAALCAPGFTTCSAAQWSTYRGDTIPTNDYWTNDNLRYSGTANACQAVTTGGTSCGTNRPMRVCTPDGSDGYGNTCTWTDCGLNSTQDQYFGGCVANPTAGSLCCAQPVCAGNRAPDDVFTPGMIGCGGTKTWDQRAALCAPGYAPCSAAQWNAYRGSHAPTKDYWTDDNLRYSGTATACQAVTSGGTSCGTNRPMRVCTPGGTDSYGNTCTWTGCGLGTTENQYFGGCTSNPTAGTLCCAQ